jgi:hypothetical protein
MFDGVGWIFVGALLVGALLGLAAGAIISRIL